MEPANTLATSGYEPIEVTIQFSGSASERENALGGQPAWRVKAVLKALADW